MADWLMFSLLICWLRMFLEMLEIFPLYFIQLKYFSFNINLQITFGIYIISSNADRNIYFTQTTKTK